MGSESLTLILSSFDLLIIMILSVVMIRFYNIVDGHQQVEKCFYNFRQGSGLDSCGSLVTWNKEARAAWRPAAASDRLARAETGEQPTSPVGPWLAVTWSVWTQKTTPAAPSDFLEISPVAFFCRIWNSPPVFPSMSGVQTLSINSLVFSFSRLGFLVKRDHQMLSQECGHKAFSL